MSQHFIDMAQALNVNYDVFLRTTEQRHHTASQEIWKRMEANGDLYLDRYEGWYSVRDEAYYDERTGRRGRGVKLSPQGTPVEWTVEESWFFRLSKYQDKLLALYSENPDFIRPEARRNEMVAFVSQGLRDLSVSRTSFDWGVKVPGSDNHVMYVWVDALTNYLTGLGWPEETDAFAKYWPANLHLIGKDIVRFHTIYWPAFLMSANLPVPHQVFGHGFLLNRGQKDRSRSAMSPIPSNWPKPLAWMPCAISSCAKWHSGRTARGRPKRSSRAAMPSWPTAMAIWSSACCP
jgi:methionyl-tRNA synthetase